MADATRKKLGQLLEPERPADVRAAAVVVLAELGAPDPALARLLCDLVDDPDPAVRVRALGAVGKLRLEPALPRLLARVGEGGVEAETAARAAARLGARGTRALQELMPRVAPGLRRRIAAALAAGDSASAEAAAVDALRDADPNVVDAAARSLLGKVPTLGTSHRRRLAEHALDVLRAPPGSAPLAPATEIALVRLLAALDDPRAEAAFWERLEPGRPPEVRAAALQALGRLPTPPSRDRLPHLLACAADSDFRVAAPALMVLKAMPLADRGLGDWLALFDAPDPAVRRFALEKLGDRDRPEVARALLAQLDHPDRSLHADAVARLARLKHGREALARSLLEADSPEKAWALARAQAAFAGQYPTELRKALFGQACRYLEGNDRRADALLFLLREAEGRELRDRIEERALALRKKKQYAVTLTYLRLLARDPACADGVRLEQAGCGLKVSDHDLAAEARAADPSLAQFAAVLNRRAVDAVDFVGKAKWLAPEDLFYLGFHFVEGRGPEKEFGVAVLRLLVRRSPGSKWAKDARNKLRSQGLT
jgi:HEAT repeat protein